MPRCPRRRGPTVCARAPALFVGDDRELFLVTQGHSRGWLPLLTLRQQTTDTLSYLVGLF